MTLNAIESVSFLRDREIELAPPLSAAELSGVEQKFGISFAADHAAMLQLAMPVGPQWPNWPADDDGLRARLAWPVDGVLFDVENSGCWLERWGPRPARARDAVRVARARLTDWPQPVPIYSHRYMTEGSATDAPVLSIHQSDVIVYGLNLLDYLHQEFGSRKSLEGRPNDNHLAGPDPWLALVDD